MGNPNKVVDDAEGFMSDDEDFDFATKSPPTPDPMAGIGYWVSPGNSPKKCPNICGSVQNFIAAFKEDILWKRHRFPTGILMDAVKKDLPGSDEDAIKSEIEVQVSDLLFHNVNIESKLQPHPNTDNSFEAHLKSNASWFNTTPEANFGDEDEEFDFETDESLTVPMLEQMADAVNVKIVTQGNKRREMKYRGFDEASMKEELDVFLALKEEYKAITGEEWWPLEASGGGGGGSAGEDGAGEEGDLELIHKPKECDAFDSTPVNDMYPYIPNIWACCNERQSTDEEDELEVECDPPEYDPNDSILVEYMALYM